MNAARRFPALFATANLLAILTGTAAAAGVVARADVLFIRGDTSADGTVALADPVEALNWLFLGGREPACLDAADADDSGDVQVADAIGVLNWLFLGGPPPVAPGPFRCGPDPTTDRLGCRSFRACGGERPPVRVFRNGDGSPNGVRVHDLSDALFRATPGSVEESFHTWILANSAVLGFAEPPVRGTLEALSLESGVVPSTPGLFSMRFANSYRGHPVVGPAESVILTLAQDAQGVRALSVTGTFLDDRLDYDGIGRDRLSENEAREYILLAWFGFAWDVGPTRRRGQIVGKMDLVAVPEHEAMAWRGEILEDDDLLASVYVHASSGEPLGYDFARHYDLFDDKTVRVLAYAMADNPDTEQAVLYPTPGSTYGACGPLPPAGFGCLLRMGDENAAVYDFEEDNDSAPVIYTALEYQPGIQALVPLGLFVEDDRESYKFTTQNIHHKLHAALAAVNPLKGPLGWDHHPDAPFSLFEPAPLTVMTNIDYAPVNDPCSDNLGAFFETTFEGWEVVEHPYPGDDFPSAAIALCQHNEGTLFHELGHYYDMYSAHGILGSGLLSGTCQWDTTDESRALRETLADMVRVCLYKKLYPQMPFDLSTTDDPCTFNAMGASVAVHGGPCGGSLVEFDGERPSPSGAQQCSVSAGYRLASVHQALWKFVNGRFCAESAPNDCLFLVASPAGPAVDAALESMLYALSLSNLQSYEQFFENMDLYIEFRYGEGYHDLFRSNCAMHGLLAPELGGLVTDILATD